MYNQNELIQLVINSATERTRHCNTSCLSLCYFNLYRYMLFERNQTVLRRKNQAENQLISGREPTSLGTLNLCGLKAAFEEVAFSHIIYNTRSVPSEYNMHKPK